MNNNIFNLDSQSLTTISAEWHTQNLKVILTNGCYDILHVGHLHTFNEAKKLGDILVVGVNSDQSIKLNKGPKRPILPEQDRCQLVAALKPVDYVILFNEINAVNLIAAIQPQVYVKGGDYSLDSLPEKEILVKLKVAAQFIPLVAGNSSTAIIERICNI